MVKKSFCEVVTGNTWAETYISTVPSREKFKWKRPKTETSKDRKKSSISVAQ
jgi:hypothetical protein